VATIIQGQKRVAFGHYGFYATHAGGDLPVIVRRSIGDPTCWMHENSRPVMLQRERFKKAVQHYAGLTPPQKWLSKRRLGDVEYIDNHGVTQVKMLSGRQLVISEDIHALATTGRFTEQPFQVCIILCDQDFEPLVGELYLEYQDAGGWHEVEGRELNLGNWLFVEVPGKMTAYRVWGGAVGWQDPMLPENQNMSEAQLKLKHWHKMEVPPVTMEFRQRFYPDPFPRLPAVDGQTALYGPYAGLTWDELHDGAGNEGTHLAATMSIDVMASRTAQKWRRIGQAILMFDTYVIPADAEILEAQLWLWCYGKSLPPLGDDFSIIITKANPASEDEITPADYQCLGTQSLCGDPFPVANLVYQGWTCFTFTEWGLTQLLKRGVTKLGIRNYEYDARDEAPTWYKSFYGSAVLRGADGPFDTIPYLDIKFEVPT